MTPRRVTLPRALAPGSRVAVVAPGSPVDRRRLNAGLRVLESWGLVPILGDTVYEKKGDLAGDDAARLDDLAWALGSDDVDAVWGARGGWGTARLLDRLDGDMKSVPPRWLYGSSDLTALQSWLLGRGRPSWYAPLVVELADGSRYRRRFLDRAVFDPLAPIDARIARAATLVRGRASGTLAGGCLSVLAALAGTKHAAEFKDRIVFLEDVGEPPYKIDRMLWQLRESGAFDRIAGLVFAQFTRCRPGRGRSSRSLADVMREHAEAIGVPAMSGYPAGHGPKTLPLPIGFDATLDASASRLRIAPPAGHRGRRAR